LVQNTGNGALAITAIEITGNYPNQYIQTNNCGTSLAPGAGCTITVEFAPVNFGSITAAVSLFDSAGNSPQSVALSGTGTSSPLVSLSAASLAFGNQVEGTAGPAQSLTVTNVGHAALSIAQIWLTGAYPASFKEANTCGSSLRAGTSCIISVQFAPSAVGSFAATVTLNDNAPNSPQSVNLSGIGTASSSANLSTASLAFGNQATGTISSPQSIGLQNTGNGALTITAIEITGAYPSQYIESNNCGTSLAAGAGCTIKVQFAPIISGSITAAVTLFDNASSSPQSVALSGTGTSSPLVSLSAASLAFGNQVVGTTSPAQSFTVTNTGTVALSITQIWLTGAYPTSFDETNNCGSSLAAETSCTISVQFAPSGAGSFAAAVTINDNASNSPQCVTLSGTGASPAVSLSPSSLSFGNELAGAASSSQAITLSNTGNAALSITGLTLTGANPSDFAQSNTCGASVAAGASCTISVTFTPAASGSFTAAVSVADNASGSPQTVALSGTGTTAGVSLSPGSLAFGSEPVAVASSLQTITLSNTGSAALSITNLTISGANPGDFSETADTCGSSVAAGGNCTIGITFTPSQAGAETASVNVADNAAGSPQTATLSGTGTHDITLAWTGSTSSGVAGYNLYRGTTSGGESATPINCSLITVTTYTDSNVQAGQTYYYILKAVGSDDSNQSADSSEASTTVPSP
jgi:hypothetical protein